MYNSSTLCVSDSCDFSVQKSLSTLFLHNLSFTGTIFFLKQFLPSCLLQVAGSLVSTSGLSFDFLRRIAQSFITFCSFGPKWDIYNKTIHEYQPVVALCCGSFWSLTAFFIGFSMWDKAFHGRSVVRNTWHWNSCSIKIKTNAKNIFYFSLAIFVSSHSPSHRGFTPEQSIDSQDSVVCFLSLKRVWRRIYHLHASTKLFLNFTSLTSFFQFNTCQFLQHCGWRNEII